MGCIQPRLEVLAGERLTTDGRSVLCPHPQSDSLGYVYKPDGFTMADLEQVGL